MKLRSHRVSAAPPCGTSTARRKWRASLPPASAPSVLSSPTSPMHVRSRVVAFRRSVLAVVAAQHGPVVSVCVCVCVCVRASPAACAMFAEASINALVSPEMAKYGPPVTRSDAAFPEMIDECVAPTATALASAARITPPVSHACCVQVRHVRLCSGSASSLGHQQRAGRTRLHDGGAPQPAVQKGAPAATWRSTSTSISITHALQATAVACSHQKSLCAALLCKERMSL